MPPAYCIEMGSSPIPIHEQKKAPRKGCFLLLVPVTGLEPVRHRWRRILSPVSGLETYGIQEKTIEYHGTEKCCHTNDFFCFLQENRCRAPPFETFKK